MNKPHSASPRNSLLKTVAVAVAVSSVAASIGWVAARRSSLPPPAQSADGAPTPAANAAPQTPEQILDAIPDAELAAAGASVKKVDEEIARFKTLARSKPDEPKHWISLGDALMQKSREIVEPHYCDFAEMAYARSLSLAPKNPEAMLGLAWVTSTRHQFTESIDWANKALAVAPQLHAAHGLIGDAQVEIGDYEAAFKSYQTMLDIRPDISSYSRGAHLLYLTGDSRKAIWLMNTAIKSGGPYAENTAWCRAQLAEMLLDTGATLPAEETIKQGLKATPDNYHLLSAMGRVKQAKGDLKGAIALYRKATAVTPQHNALVALGDLLLADGSDAEAEKIFKQVEENHEHHIKHGLHDELYMARFWAEHDRQKERALQIAEAHREAQGPVDADSVAWVFYKSGKNDDAKIMIDKALAKGSPDAMRLYHAGMIYAKAGERVPAQKYLYQALNKNPYFSLKGAAEASETLKQLGAKTTANAK